MRKNENWIRVNKCVIGKTYYLSGEYYDEMTGESKVNTPIIFIGRDKARRWNGNPYSGSLGQYIFKTLDGKYEIEANAKQSFKIKPI